MGLTLHCMSPVAWKFQEGVDLISGFGAGFWRGFVRLGLLGFAGDRAADQHPSVRTVTAPDLSPDASWSKMKTSQAAPIFKPFNPLAQ